MALAKTVIGIPIEQEMLDVVNLTPGQSAPFLFYTVHFIDLQNPVGFEDKIESLLKDTTVICTRGSAGGLPASYIAKAQAKSRYLVVAIGKDPNDDEATPVGAFVLARPDHDDPAGIYVEAMCNIQSTTLTREHPLFNESKAKLTAEVNNLSKQELVDEYNLNSPPGKQITVQKLAMMEKTYRSVVAKRRLDALDLKPTEAKVSIRTAQLLQLALFNYANRVLNMKHAYNAASGIDAAKTHARNGMTLRSANCGQVDQLAEQFSAVPLEEKAEYMQNLVKEGKFKLDASDSYPMKLCNYNFNKLFANLLDHTLVTLTKLENAGFNTEDIRSYDISY
jgi:hypothetical protein